MPSNDRKPHTSSWRTFEENLDGIIHMMKLSTREARRIGQAAKRLSQRLDGASIVNETHEGRKRLMRSLRHYGKTLKLRIERSRVLHQWQVVMLVTCVEAYLQDVLALAASVDPLFMGRSEQVASYADIVAATSVEVLATELRTRWARAWVSDGGPAKWISRLERMGARGYAENTGSSLEIYWGIRHVVVHAAGITTTDFIRRYPGARASVGERLNVTSHDLVNLTQAIVAFLEPTESYFISRYPDIGSVVVEASRSKGTVPTLTN